jgi:hypothetical protein
LFPPRADTQRGPGAAQHRQGRGLACVATTTRERLERLQRLEGLEGLEGLERLEDKEATKANDYREVRGDTRVAREDTRVAREARGSSFWPRCRCPVLLLEAGAVQCSAVQFRCS